MIVPSEAEIKENNLTRSAKLRIDRKKIQNERAKYTDLLKAKFLIDEDALKNWKFIVFLILLAMVDHCKLAPLQQKT